MRTHYVVFVAILLLATGATSRASAHTCPLACPGTGTGFRTLTITDLFGGVINNCGANTYNLGTYGGALVACTGSTIRYLKDVTSSSYPSSLLGDSVICWDTNAGACGSPGNDVIVVKTTSFSCGSQTIQAFAYGGYRLRNHGEGGDDTLWGGNQVGGTGGQDSLCGGDGNDSLEGFSGQDWLDGLDNDDYCEGGNDTDEIYGYEGQDTIIDNAASNGDTLLAENGNDTCVYDASAGALDVINCGAGTDSTRNSCGPAVNCDGNCGLFCWP